MGPTRRNFIRTLLTGLAAAFVAPVVVALRLLPAPLVIPRKNGKTQLIFDHWVALHKGPAERHSVTSEMNGRWIYYDRANWRYSDTNEIVPAMVGFDMIDMGRG